MLANLFFIGVVVVPMIAMRPEQIIALIVIGLMGYALLNMVYS